MAHDVCWPIERLYNLITHFASASVGALAYLSPREPHSKLRRFAKAHRGLLTHIERSETRAADRRPVIWFHSSSLGEFQIARPIIKSLKAHADCRVIVTFFSPSGYEPVKTNTPAEIDAVYYLPLDTPGNMRRTVEALNPSVAVVMVSEFWHNMLKALSDKRVPLLLVSAKIRRDSIFFSRWGGLYRRSLRLFDHVFALDSDSHSNIQRLNQSDVSEAGNPLFDNIAERVATNWTDVTIERFKGNDKMVVAGSLHLDRDLDMVAEAIDRMPGMRFLIVPHEPTHEAIKAIKKRLSVPVALYSASSDANESDSRVMILDTIGLLSLVYRYADGAYVGGGFTRKLHNVLEPAAYGIPICFGPRIHRKAAPEALIEKGIGRVVESEKDMKTWIEEDVTDPRRRLEIKQAALAYCEANRGASVKIANAIAQRLKRK